jgi:hypothetical protein
VRRTAAVVVSLVLALLTTGCPARSKGSRPTVARGFPPKLAGVDAQNFAPDDGTEAELTWTIALYKTADGDRVGVGHVRGRDASKALLSTIGGERPVRTSSGDTVFVGKVIRTGRTRSPIVGSVYGSTGVLRRRDAHFAIADLSTNDLLAMTPVAFSKDPAKHGWRLQASGDVSTVLPVDHALPRGRCGATYGRRGRSDPFPEFSIGLAEFELPVDVLRWWFGSSARARKYRTRQSLIVTFPKGNVEIAYLSLGNGMTAVLDPGGPISQRIADNALSELARVDVEERLACPGSRDR